jgi:outer membrane murein-binding lipoprotein Lpp
MPPEVIPLMSVIMGTLMISGSVWAVAWYNVKKKEFETRGGGDELGEAVDALRTEIDRLADQQDATQAQLLEVQERLDFTERMLTAGRVPKDS